MAKEIKPKRSGLSLEARSFKGSSGQTYLTFKTLEGGYHVFVETEATAAAKDCGGRGKNTRQLWDSLFKI